MSALGEKITVIRSGDELFDVWEDLEHPVPQDEKSREVWANAVEARTPTFLAARLGGLAIGTLFIKWDGPVKREHQFTEALEAAFPGVGPIPTIYDLYVHPQFRGHQLGWRMTADAEQRIKRRKNVPKIAALYVGTDNVHSLPICNNRGYEIIPYQNQYAVVIDRPTPSNKSKTKKPVYFMAKDLS